MRVTPDFDSAFAELEGAANDLAASLESVRSAVATSEQVDGEALADELEQRAQRYVSVSERLGNSVIEGIEPAGTTDEDAVARMNASIALDLKVAEQLAALAPAESPPDAAESQAGPQTFLSGAADAEFLAALDQAGDLRSEISPLLHVINGEGDGPTEGLGASESATGAASTTSVTKAVDRILADGGTTIAGTVAAVTMPDATQINQIVEHLLGDRAGQVAKTVVDALHDWWKRLSKWAAQVLALVLKKIKDIIGSKALDEFLTQSKEWLTEKWEQLSQGNPAGVALGLLLGREALVQGCDTRLAALDPTRAEAAVKACEAVAGAHENRVGYVRWGNSALGFAGGTAIVKASPLGLTLLALVGVALVAYTIWLGQDHLDAVGLDFLPNRILGVSGTVLAA